MKIIKGFQGAAFGLSDGLIMLLGLVIGVAEATSSSTSVIIAGIAGGIANSFGNAIGFYISELEERGQQIYERSKFKNKVSVHSKREVIVSGIFSFFSTLFALIVPIAPFFFFEIYQSMLLAIIVAVIILFLLGNYVGRLSGESPIRLGIKFAILGIAGAVICYLVGDFLKHLLIEGVFKIF
jgi:predicted membrane protein (TIGR00267 family)